MNHAPSLSNTWSSIETPYMGPLIPAKKVLCWIIPKSHFGVNISRWQDINNEHTKKLVGFFSDIIQRPDLETGPFDSKKYVNDSLESFKAGRDVSPRVVFSSETLVSNEGTWEALRNWIFIMDPSFDINERIKKMLEINKEENAKPKNKKKLDSGNPFLSHRTITTMESLIQEVFMQYLGPNSSVAMMQSEDLKKKENDPSNPNSIINIENIFSIDKAFNDEHPFLSNVCREDKNPANYFDTEMGLSASSFKSFPKNGKKCSRIPNRFMNPNILPSSLLPNIQFLEQEATMFQMGQINKIKEGMNAELRELKICLSAKKIEYGNDPNKKEELVTLENKISELSKNIAKSQSNIDGMFVQDLGSFNDEPAILNIDRQYASKRFGDFLNKIGDASGKEEDDNNPDDFFTGNPETIFARKNDFIALRMKNKEMKNIIRDNYVPGTKEYSQAMTSFKNSAVHDFWRVFMTSEKLTGPAKSLRKWLKTLQPSQKFVEFNMSFTNVSAFANMIIKMIKIFSGSYRVESSFQVVMMAFLTALSSFTYVYGLRPNLLLSGDAGIGKSYILNLIREVFFDGAVVEVTNLTRHAFHTDMDFSDFLMVLHEAPLYIFGIGKDGKEIPADPFFKDRTTKGWTSTLAYDSSNKTKRKATFIATRVGGGVAMGLNEKIPSDHHAVTQRFVHNPVRRKGEGNGKYKTYEAAFDQNWTKDEKQKSKHQHDFKVMTSYCYMVEKLIETGIFDPVDTDIATLAVDKVFEVLKENGIKKPDARQVEKYTFMAGRMAILYSVYMVFGSELSVSTKISNNNFRDFSPDMLLKTEQWLVTTEEISVFLLTLLEHIWIPHLMVDMINVLAVKMNHSPLDKDNTRYRQEYNIGLDNKLSDISTDYTYIMCTSNSFDNMVDEITQHISPKPSISHVTRMIESMQRQMVECEVMEIRSDCVKGSTDVISSVVPVKNTSKARPMIIVDDDHKTKKKRISLLTYVVQQYVGKDYKKVFMDAIKKTFSYSSQEKRKFLTAMPFCPRRDLVFDNYESAVEHGDNDDYEKYILKEYPSVFDVIEIDRDPNNILIQNNIMCDDEMEMNILDNTVIDQHEVRQIDKEPAFKVDNMRLEQIHFAKRFMEIGLNKNEPKNEVSIPIVTETFVLMQRKSGMYSEINKRLDDNYPFSVAKSLDKKVVKIERSSRGAKREYLTRLPDFSDRMLGQYMGVDGKSSTVSMSNNPILWSSGVAGYRGESHNILADIAKELMQNKVKRESKKPPENGEQKKQNDNEYMIDRSDLQPVSVFPAIKLKKTNNLKSSTQDEDDGDSEGSNSNSDGGIDGDLDANNSKTANKRKYGHGEDDGERSIKTEVIVKKNKPNYAVDYYTKQHMESLLKDTRFGVVIQNFQDKSDMNTDTINMLREIKKNPKNNMYGTSSIKNSGNNMVTS